MREGVRDFDQRLFGGEGEELARTQGGERSKKTYCRRATRAMYSARQDVGSRRRPRATAPSASRMP